MKIINICTIMYTLFIIIHGLFGAFMLEAGWLRQDLWLQAGGLLGLGTASILFVLMGAFTYFDNKSITTKEA